MATQIVSTNLVVTKQNYSTRIGRALAEHCITIQETIKTYTEKENQERVFVLSATPGVANLGLNQTSNFL